MLRAAEAGLSALPGCRPGVNTVAFHSLVLRLDQSRKLIGADYYDGTFPTSTSGYFVVDMKGPAGKALVGSAHSTPAAAAGTHGVKADVTFRADLK